MSAEELSGVNGAAGSTLRPFSTRDFLSRVLPWPAPDQSGWCNVHYTIPGKDVGYPGRPYKELDKFLAMVDWGKAHPKNVSDIFFCLSRQSQVGEKIGNTFRALRRKENALAIKAIYLDVDVKEGRGYEDILSAVKAVNAFTITARLPWYTALVGSGGGLHVYMISDKPLSLSEWAPFAEGLRFLAEQHGLRCDLFVTTDCSRVLRVPGTFNRKTSTPRPVKLLYLDDKDIDFDTALAHIKRAPLAGAPSPKGLPLKLVLFESGPPPFDLGEDLNSPEYQTKLGRISDGTPDDLDAKALLDHGGCPFFQDALRTGGANVGQGLWMMTALACTFLRGGRELFHRLSKGHKTYTYEDTDAMFDRKLAERDKLGWPHCATMQKWGSQKCAGCEHLNKMKSPLHLIFHRLPDVTGQSATPDPSFVDPFSEFAGPAFPVDMLPPTLSNFVYAQQRALGADAAALAMAALAAVAMHADTVIRASEGWWERPILWVALIGRPSTMKTPIMGKATAVLGRIDSEQNKNWHEQYAQWKRQNEERPAHFGPAKPPRCLINDATPEKIAEILSRGSRGSTMLQDELTGLLGSFERYNSGQASRAFFLSCWNGGLFLKDRVGKGKSDPDAEIHVDNLALCVLGGIQPDKLANLRDLTADGLLQRFLPVLMVSAERGDHYASVAQHEAAYDAFIRSIYAASPQKYHLADDALEIRDRVLEHLHNLETVDGFSPPLMSAIGKLKGYFFRICLILHVARLHDPLNSNGRQSNFVQFIATPEDIEQTAKAFGIGPDDKWGSLSEGIHHSNAISRQTAEATEKVLKEFILPSMLGLYDFVVSGGQDRDLLRSIASFILASNKDRLRPSDFTAGVRGLKGMPEAKIREWVGRFCVMDWLQPEEKVPSLPPKAWHVSPGLREHFAEHRRKAEEARAAARAILKAGGTGRST
jgi:hypothetical protein